MVTLFSKGDRSLVPEGKLMGVELIGVYKSGIRWVPEGKLIWVEFIGVN